MTTTLARVPARRRPRYPACACRTLWLVDFGDDPRGEKPVSSYTAAVASAMGYRVRLVSYATGMLRPFVLPGTTYGKVHVAEVVNPPVDGCVCRSRPTNNEQYFILDY